MRPLQLYGFVRRTSHPRPHSSRAGLGCAALLLSLLALVVLAGGLVYANLTANLPSPEMLPALLDPVKGGLAQPTRLYDRTGQYVLYTLENPGIPRRYLWLDPEKPDHFSPLLVQVIVSADDASFWRHAGVTWQSLQAPEPLTLAERLVNRYLLDGEAPGWQRNVRMHLLAAQITARFGRAQVLEWYLNNAYFGHAAYGADSAARLYLNKPATDLNLAEVSLLVAVEEAPALNPVDAPKAALENQRLVLDRLLEKHIVDQRDYLTARAAQLDLRGPAEQPVQPAGAFARLVLGELSQSLGQERLERGGLRILTTLDYDLQLDLDCAARAQIGRLLGQTTDATRPDGRPCQASRLLPTLTSEDRGLSKDLQASVAVLDLAKGEVLAYVGGIGASGQRLENPVYQPGSLLTPFVALAGFARGMGPASMVWDIPASLPEEMRGSSSSGSSFHGPVRLRIAMANDYLAPFTQLMAQVGPANVWRLAEPFGLRGFDKAQNPNGLLYGGGEVSLLEIAQAYETFANLGVQVGTASQGSASPRPVLVSLVQDGNGQILLAEPQEEPLAVLSAPLAYLIHTILADDTARRTSLGYPNPLEIGRPSAGKTGRVADGSQVWTIGYTPQRLAVAGLGMTPKEGDARLSEKMAAGLWYAAMQTSSRGLPVVGWSEPAGLSHLEVCDPSGLKPTPVCPNIVNEVFLNGSEPVETDTLYRSRQINRETGRLATVFTPPALIEEKTFLIPPPEARQWAQDAGLAKPPDTYDSIQEGQESADVHITSPAGFAYVRGRVAILGSAAGEDFSSYRLQAGQGLNPQAWVQIGEESLTPVQEGGLGFWDTQGLEGLYALRLQVIHKDNRIETATIQVTVDNTPPQVKIDYPGSGQTVTGSSGIITLQVQAQDAIGVVRLEWYIDGQKVGDSALPSTSFAWPAQQGKHTVLAKAFDAAGNMGESAPVDFIVK